MASGLDRGLHLPGLHFGEGVSRVWNFKVQGGNKIKPPSSEIRTWGLDLVTGEARGLAIEGCHVGRDAQGDPRAPSALKNLVLPP